MSDPAVDALVYDPQLGAVIARLRGLLAALPGVTEGLKWAAPSYRTEADWFATLNKPRDRLPARIILHRGAKKRATALGPGDVADPAGLLVWLGPDRAAVSFADRAALDAAEGALVALLRAWAATV